MTEALQKNSTSVSDLRVLFEAVIEKYPDTTYRLSASADIIYSSTFYNAVVKIQHGNSSAMSREELIPTRNLSIEESTHKNVVHEGLSFAERVLQE